MGNPPWTCFKSFTWVSFTANSGSPHYYGEGDSHQRLWIHRDLSIENCFLQFHVWFQIFLLSQYDLWGGLQVIGLHVPSRKLWNSESSSPCHLICGQGRTGDPDKVSLWYSPWADRGSSENSGCWTVTSAFHKQHHWQSKSETPSKSQHSPCEAAHKAILGLTWANGKV